MTDELPPFPPIPRLLTAFNAPQYSAQVAAWSAECARISFAQVREVRAALARIEAKLNGGMVQAP